MIPSEAKTLLEQMGCIQNRGPAGFFVIVKAPQGKRELDLFVRCVSTLGSWSGTDGTGKRRVEVQRGYEPDEVLFRVNP